MLVYREFGFALPDNPGAQMGYGRPVPGGFANTQAGDLVFWAEGGGGITHVGISMGDGVNVIHASNYEGQVVIAPAQYINGYAGARRLL